MVHARRVAVALATVFLALGLTAAPAAASQVWVGVGNDGPEPLLVSVLSGQTLLVNLKPGCEQGPAAGASFAVCLPGGAFLAFTVNVPALTD